MGKKPRSDRASNDGAAGQKEQNNYHSRNDNVAHETRTENAKQNKQNLQAKYDYRQNQLQDSKDYSSFKVVLFYCSLIVFLPVVTFFMLKSFVLDSLFALTEVQGNIYAAMGAVISLHIALALYIYRAYFSTDPPNEGARKKLN